METTRNIEFAPQLTPMQLDVYRPAGAGKRTAVLLLHGGAWRIGSRSDLAPHAKALTERGFVVIAADYRLLPANPWPSQVRDVRAAISWVRQHASELQVQDDRIVGFGYSAGAHLALLAAADPEGSRWDRLGRQALSAVIAVEPPVAFHDGPTIEEHHSVAARLLGKGATPDDIAAASPLTYVTKAFPPTCFFHGLEDKHVPPAASLTMHRALVDAGVTADLHILGGYAHAIWRFDRLMPWFMDTVSLFLDRTVVDPATHAKEYEDFWVGAREREGLIRSLT